MQPHKKKAKTGLKRIASQISSAAVAFAKIKSASFVIVRVVGESGKVGIVCSCMGFGPDGKWSLLGAKYRVASRLKRARVSAKAIRICKCRKCLSDVTSSADAEMLKLGFARISPDIGDESAGYDDCRYVRVSDIECQKLRFRMFSEVDGENGKTMYFLRFDHRLDASDPKVISSFYAIASEDENAMADAISGFVSRVKAIAPAEADAMRIEMMIPK
jgi:hypothetical protein